VLDPQDPVERDVDAGLLAGLADRGLGDTLAGLDPAGG
jgi:hypothetical protein